MRLWLTAIVAACTAAPLAAQEVQTVPGFADFLAVDGQSVWATNHGRVERWSHDGKQAEVKLTHPCGAMARKAGSLWVADCKDGTLNRIDLRKATITATIPTGIANPKGELNVVAGAGSIWVASDDKGTIARVDPHTNTVIASITVAPSTYYLAFGFGKLWAVTLPGQLLQEIDPHTNTVVHSTALGQAPGFLAAGAKAVWVQEQGDGTVARIDPHSGEVIGRVKVGDNLKWGDIDTGGGKVWLRTTDDQVYVVLDPRTTAVVKRVGAAAGSGALRYTHGGVWTTAHDQHTLTWWAHPLG